jgi:acyl carrier protein
MTGLGRAKPAVTSVIAPVASGPMQGVPGGLEEEGMYELVEPQVRRVVAEHLGVGIENLVSDVSLREDLATDSLDLVELQVALEGEFAIVVTEQMLDQMRTYGDLVHVTGVLISERVQAEARGAEPPPPVWAAAGESVGTLDRTDRRTPYTAETIAGNARRTSTRTHVEVAVALSTRDGLARVREQLARVCRRGVEVIVRRGERPGMPAAVPRP